MHLGNEPKVQSLIGHWQPGNFQKHLRESLEGSKYYNPYKPTNATEH